MESKFEITSVTPVPKRNIRKDCDYPFAQLNHGQGFYVTDKALYKTVRVQAAKFNKRNGTMIHCNILEDGRLQVWRDNDNAPAVTVSTSVGITDDDSIATNPSKAEFQAYLASLSPGATFVLKDQSRFEQFKRWTAETELPFSALEIVAGQLTIVRGKD